MNRRIKGLLFSVLFIGQLVLMPFAYAQPTEVFIVAPAFSEETTTVVNTAMEAMPAIIPSVTLNSSRSWQALRDICGCTWQVAKICVWALPIGIRDYIALPICNCAVNLYTNEIYRHGWKAGFIGGTALVIGAYLLYKHKYADKDKN